MVFYISNVQSDCMMQWTEMDGKVWWKHAKDLIIACMACEKNIFNDLVGVK